MNLFISSVIQKYFEPVAEVRLTVKEEQSTCEILIEDLSQFDPSFPAIVENCEMPAHSSEEDDLMLIKRSTAENQV
jgi:hypothetical protein